MSTKHKEHKHKEHATIESVLLGDLAAPFAPEPTVFTGGLTRMVKAFEDLRALNKKGYGSGLLLKVWGAKPCPVTSCSPFTGTVIGLLSDTEGQVSSTAKIMPRFDSGRRELPKLFYTLHNDQTLPAQIKSKVSALGFHRWRDPRRDPYCVR